MAKLPVSRIKGGEKLDEDIVSERGNVLFYKGSTLTERDTEVLKAFFVSSVSVQYRQSGMMLATERNEKKENNKEVITESPFDIAYHELFSFIQHVFNNAHAMGNIPILDIRKKLDNLLQHIGEYHILTFRPKIMNPQDLIFHNSIQVSLTSYLLAKWNSYPNKDLIPIALGGLFHDIGLLAYTTEEKEEIKQHTVVGYHILKNISAINEGVKLCALQHHERIDGSGYPLGVRGDSIHAYSKIVAIADLYHTMRSDSTSNFSTSPFLILEQLWKQSFGEIDPAIVQTLINKSTQLHNGTIVKLDDGRIGEIIFLDQTNPTRPWVNIKGTILNLTQERKHYIQEIIKL